jgi:hypothetical protein
VTYNRRALVHAGVLKLILNVDLEGAILYASSVNTAISKFIRKLQTGKPVIKGPGNVPPASTVLSSFQRLRSKLYLNDTHGRLTPSGAILRLTIGKLVTGPKT